MFEIRNYPENSNYDGLFVIKAFLRLIFVEVKQLFQFLVKSRKIF